MSLLDNFARAFLTSFGHKSSGSKVEELGGKGGCAIKPRTEADNRSIHALKAAGLDVVFCEFPTSAAFSFARVLVGENRP